MVDAQVPTKATVLDLKTEFGLSACVLSGCTENPQNRVFPTLAVLKERQAAARLGIDSSNARILSQVPRGSKGCWEQWLCAAWERKSWAWCPKQQPKGKMPKPKATALSKAQTETMTFSNDANRIKSELRDGR